jgi:two-component system heavy metal sensor histidine kinase CusS
MPEFKSLSKRLLVWQILLSVTSLTVMCVVVYQFLALQLDVKQSTVVRQNLAIIEHLVAEADQLGSTAELVHKLTDLLSVKTDIGISIQAAQGGIVFNKERSFEANSLLKSERFDIPTNRWGAVSVDLSLDISSDRKLKEQFAWLLIALSVLGSMLIASAGYWISRSGLRPLRQLTQQIQGLSITDLHARLDASVQPQEIQGLVTQFNSLLVRLQHSYEQMEHFNANVAHELKNPIANLITSHELALRSQGMTETHSDFLASNLEELLRISGIVNDMLFLSRADSGILARTQWVESIASLAQSVADYYDASAENADVSIVVVGDVQAKVDAGLFKRALSNLLSNAIRYADKQSTIQINIQKTTKASDWASVSIINSGTPICAADLDKVFERFFRSNTARENSHNHHGLGLAIVSAIAKMHGGLAYARSQERLVEIGFEWPSNVA